MVKTLDYDFVLPQKRSRPFARQKRGTPFHWPRGKLSVFFLCKNFSVQNSESIIQKEALSLKAASFSGQVLATPQLTYHFVTGETKCHYSLCKTMQLQIRFFQEHHFWDIQTGWKTCFFFFFNNSFHRFWQTCIEDTAMQCRKLLLKPVCILSCSLSLPRISNVVVKITVF